MSVVKVGKNKWENIGKTGKRHGVMHSKKAAEKQKAAIFANDPKLAAERKLGGHKDVGDKMRQHDHHKGDKGC